MTDVKHIAEMYMPEHIYGIDIKKESVQGERCSLGEGDARNLPFEDNTFDIVYSISTFEHMNGIQKTLEEVWRVLEPYGKFHVAFATVWTSKCGHHWKSMKVFEKYKHLLYKEKGYEPSEINSSKSL